MTETIGGETLHAAIGRVAAHLQTLEDMLNRLDAAIGDGDTGITIAKGAAAMQTYLASTEPGADIGGWLAQLGVAFNKAAPSTMGALTATALMRAGKEARHRSALDAPTFARMLHAADLGIQERGKAKPGDKTIVDALHPAAEAFAAMVEQGASLKAAGVALLEAARNGRDTALPLRSKIGRAGWVGERTENQPDPGTVLLVHIFEAAFGR